MKALVITRFGGPAVLELQQVPDPHPGPEQTLVQVQAGGLNFADLLTARGGYPGTPKPPLVAGRGLLGSKSPAVGGSWDTRSGRPSQRRRLDIVPYCGRFPRNGLRRRRLRFR